MAIRSSKDGVDRSTEIEFEAQEIRDGIDDSHSSPGSSVLENLSKAAEPRRAPHQAGRTPNDAAPTLATVVSLVMVVKGSMDRGANAASVAPNTAAFCAMSRHMKEPETPMANGV